MLTFALVATIVLALLQYHDPFSINERVVKASQNAAKHLRSFRSKGILQSIEGNAQSFLDRYIGGIGHAWRALIFSILTVIFVYGSLCAFSSYMYFTDPMSFSIVNSVHNKDMDLEQLRNTFENIDAIELLKRKYGDKIAEFYSDIADIYMTAFKSNVSSKEYAQMFMWWNVNIYRYPFWL